MELVLTTRGSSLSREEQCFLISQKDMTQRIAVSEVNSISIQHGVSITSDALILAIENEIPVFITANSGYPLGRISSPKYGSISTIRKGQVHFCESSRSVEWIKNILCKKIEHQQALLLMFIDESTESKIKRSVDKSVERLNGYVEKIKSLKDVALKDVAATLRGWEGSASKIYFEEINRQIPERSQFSVRSQHPAKDHANAFLNYGYGILYGKIEAALVKAGIDPYIGVLHRDDYNRPVLVYDVIEPYRVWVDYVVVNLLNQIDMGPSYYETKGDGSCELTLLGRRTLIQAVNEYLDEIIDVDGLTRTRNTQIKLYANELAQMFFKVKSCC